MFNPSRDEVRHFFCTAWQKHRDRLPLVGVEVAAGDIAARHPEYHPLLDDAQEAVHQDWTPEQGKMNPFLHLSLHLAVFEQVSIDQPPGIRQAFTALCQKTDVHSAEHILLDCLGETIWRAQKEGRVMDTAAYLELIRQHSTRL